MLRRMDVNEGDEVFRVVNAAAQAYRLSLIHI